MRAKRRGFTLLELMVVIALIIAMLTMAMGAFAAFLTNKQIKLAGRTLTNAYRAARQFSVSNRLPCLVLFLDAGPTPTPAPAPLSSLVGNITIDRDAILVIGFESVLNTQTGQLDFLLSTGPPLFRKDLPGKIEFNKMPPNFVTGDKVFIHNPPANVELTGVSGFIFYPDGSSYAKAPTGADPPKNTVILLDPVTQEEARVYCYPVTGYTREFYDE